MDESLRLASSKAWLALIAMFVIIAASGVWAWQGTIATTVSGQAVIVRRGGITTISAQGAGGHIVAVNVAVGDRVQANQVLARIAQPSREEEIRMTEEALHQVRREQARAVSVRRQRTVDQSLPANQKLIEAKEKLAKAEADSLVKVADLERRLAELKEGMLAAASVRSPFAGEVIELKTHVGSFVTAGAPLITIQPIAGEVEALVYLPAERAKEIAPGMATRISPTSIKREEFGYIKGKVLSVAPFPSSGASLMSSLQNDTLVRILTRGAAVTEVHAMLERDPSTPSGFKWSSSDGPPASISAGTLCDADVITREQAPLSLIFPVLHKKLGD